MLQEMEQFNKNAIYELVARIGLAAVVVAALLLALKWIGML